MRRFLPGVAKILGLEEPVANCGEKDPPPGLMGFEALRFLKKGTNVVHGIEDLG